MGLRTVLLKLHQPGKTKREILDKAILNYNRAYQYLLGKAYPDLDNIQRSFKDKQGLYNANTLSKWVSKELSTELNRYDVQPFKDSLKLELGMALASYLRLDEMNAKVHFPKLTDLEDGAGTEQPVDRVPDGERMRPVYFCRYDITRSYCLLYDDKKDRYYAKLYVLNAKNAQMKVPGSGEGNRLQYIHKSGSFLEGGQKKVTYIILPLAFGKYQEGFLRQALERPESLRTAKLIKKKNEYFLAVSVETGSGPQVTPHTFLGVARGLKNRLNYTIINMEGMVLDSGSIPQPAKKSRGNGIPFNELHQAANHIVDMAFRNQARVILQNLDEKGDGIQSGLWDKFDVKPPVGYRQYMQLTGILAYKLPEKGLPPPVKVSSVDIFYSCHACGSRSKRNRFTKDLFICTECGTTMDTEKLGSFNLARKLIQYSTAKIKVRVKKTPEGAWFSNEFIGLNCFIPDAQNQIHLLREEIKKIAENIKNDITVVKDKTDSKRISILKKLDNEEDIINLIDFV